MSLRKRLRILWAVFRQEWHEVTCPDCGGIWVTQNQYSSSVCQDCDERMTRVWARREEARKFQQKRG